MRNIRRNFSRRYRRWIMFGSCLRSSFRTGRVVVFCCSEVSQFPKPSAIGPNVRNANCRRACEAPTYLRHRDGEFNASAAGFLTVQYVLSLVHPSNSSKCKLWPVYRARSIFRLNSSCWWIINNTVCCEKFVNYSECCWRFVSFTPTTFRLPS